MVTRCGIDVLSIVRIALQTVSASVASLVICCGECNWKDPYLLCWTVFFLVWCSCDRVGTRRGRGWGCCSQSLIVFGNEVGLPVMLCHLHLLSRWVGLSSPWINNSSLLMFTLVASLVVVGTTLATQETFFYGHGGSFV
jgi:hypothetical protein